MVAFAYWYFAEDEVDYVVVEVGLGGLKDGTNVIKRPDKVCIITDIGYDHMAVLGNTLQRSLSRKPGLFNQVIKYLVTLKAMKLWNRLKRPQIVVVQVLR
jgi:dihydrofolate synthase/folylpolyglutamate synthase